MEDQKQQVLNSLKQATNILVTVKTNPSLDQLSACIALTLMLNGLGKHATAVFSGEVPSVLEFLEPEKTLQVNTDSLQDFIISLDKTKADKLRYKVEDTVVKIFITPYRTSLTEKDLEFGQGDFNVDVVVALGVHSQDDIDQAITAHGRILHDATVISINTTPGVAQDLGSLNWIDESISSLSELMTNASDELLEDKRAEVFDNQVATALLTGIVAETERFGNGKTKPATMQSAAKLLEAGANQELVASKLSEPRPLQPVETPHDDGPHDTTGDQSNQSSEHDDAGQSPQNGDSHTNDDGSLSISHKGDEPNEQQPESQPAAVENALISDVHHSEPSAEPDIINPLSIATAADNPSQQSYDLNQISVPASVGLTPADEIQAPRVDVNDPAVEEQAVLAMIGKAATVDDGSQSTTPIQALRDQNGFLGEPPLHDKKADASAKGQSVDESLDPTKFAVTPPSLGGALTAAHDIDSLEPTTDPLSDQPGRLTTARTLMTHEPRSFTVNEDEQAEPGSVLSGNSNSTEQPAGDVPPIVLPEAASTSEASTEASAPVAESMVPPITPASSLSYHGETLAELEAELSSPHAEAASTLDMPLPTMPPADDGLSFNDGQPGQNPPVATATPPAPPPLPVQLGSQTA